MVNSVTKPCMKRIPNIFFHSSIQHVKFRMRGERVITYQVQHVDWVCGKCLVIPSTAVGRGTEGERWRELYVSVICFYRVTMDD